MRLFIITRFLLGEASEPARGESGRMGIEITFDGKPVTGGNAPHNNKFGEAENLDDAIAKARAAHEKAGGKKEDVDNEDVVIVNNGDNMWALWEKYGKPQGVSWDDFVQSNLHLKDPKNLGGNEQSGWNDWSLVHKGDAVFIPEGKPEPATASNGTNQGLIVKDGEGWAFQMTKEDGTPESKTPLAAGQIITYDDVKYKILKVDGDTVEVQALKEDGTNEGNPTKLDLNEITK